MKNLLNQREDKVEELPKRGKYLRGYEYWDRHPGRKEPWNIIPHFLASRVGQPWDNVASEFLKKDWVPKKDRTISFLANNHNIITNTFMENGVVMYYDHSWPFKSPNHGVPVHEVTRDTYYVHPKTRCLCFQKHEVKKRKVYPITFIHLGEWHQLCKQDGIWYDVTAQKVGYYAKYDPKSPMIPYCSGRPKLDFRCLSQAATLWEGRVSRTDWCNVYVKRQLNREELKKHGLKNELPWTKEQRKKWAEDHRNY